MALSFPIGRVLGIPVRVHASWFLVFGLSTWTFATGIFAEQSRTVAFIAGVAGALMLFASVLLHELGHCVFARMYGIHVRRIQLFLFGGVAEIVGEPRKVTHEIVIAAAGPAVSFALCALLFVFAIAQLLFVGAGLSPDALGHAAQSLFEQDVLFTLLMVVGGANLMLGAFNLIPAFPTDGGRILRAVLWGVLGDYRRATSWAAGLGMVFAGGFIFLGVASALTAAWRLHPSEVAGARIGGLWWAMIGIFLARSASQAASSARISAALRSGKVSDVMGPVRASVPVERTLLEVLVGVGGPSASEMLLDGFPAAGADGRIAGFVEPARIHVVPREKWGSTRVADVMTPIASIRHMKEDDPLDTLLGAVAEQGTGVLVFRGDALVGYASRADLVRWLFRDAPENTPTK